MTRTLGDLSQEEFEHMLENMSNPEYDALTAEEFFNILAAMAPADEIHLTGHIEEGRLVFDEPAPLPVQGNVIQLGPKRIVIDVRPE
jgi:hypothetical protein